MTVDPTHELWSLARADVGSAFLPYICREIVAGGVTDVVVAAADWAKLHGYLLTLPGGKTSLPMAVSDAPPPEPIEISERAVVAGKVADIVTALGAISPFGGRALRELSGQYYAVPFAMGRFMAGVVQIYSHAYVRVQYIATTPEAPPNGLPVQDARTFDSVDKAARFLTLCIHAHKYAEALAIPQREPKRKPDDHR